MAVENPSKGWWASMVVFLMGAGFLLTIPIATSPAVNAGFGTMFVVSSLAELSSEYFARRLTDSPARLARAQRLARGVVHAEIPLAMAAMFSVVLWHELPGWATCAIVAVCAAMSGPALIDTLAVLKRPITESSSACDSPRE